MKKPKTIKSIKAYAIILNHYRFGWTIVDIYPNKEIAQKELGNIKKWNKVSNLKIIKVLITPSK